jgi:2-polyprenyl-3-methyl-5-hydroxy-6-metoxy-1,4-benzoquinol methylase
MDSAAEYRYDNAEPACTHGELLPAIVRILGAAPGCRIFEIGCGNGSGAAWLAERGYEVAGVDISESAIAHARRAYPGLNLSVGSAYDRLAERFGTFPVVLSLEVVEHLYDPRAFVRTARALVSPGGTFMLSTPYHGYWKNLVIALFDQWDWHFTALWDHGHIKFWSPRTITALLSEGGFRVERIERVGRIPALAKTMIVVARRRP